MAVFNFFVIASLLITLHLRGMEKTVIPTTNDHKEIVTKNNVPSISVQNVIDQLQRNPGLLPQRNIYIPNATNTFNTPADYNSDNDLPIMSEETKQAVQFNIERIKTIKELISTKQYFITDDAAIYLAQKTANDTDQELNGFIETITDKMLERTTITLDENGAKEAILTRKIFAQTVKKSTAQVIQDLGPAINNFQQQYEKIIADLKAKYAKDTEKLMENQGSTAMTYIYPTLICGTTASICSFAIYKMSNDNNNLMQGYNVLIDSYRKTIVDLQAESAKQASEFSQKTIAAWWESIGKTIASTVIIQGIIEAIKQLAHSI